MNSKISNKAELKVLKGWSANILSAVMNAIIPRGGAFAPGAADFDLLPMADDLLQSYDPTIRKLFPFMLLYIQYSAILRKGKVFTHLSQAQGTAVLASMESSPFFYRRIMMLFMKLLTMLVFYDNDENVKFTGYEYGCHGR